MPKGECDTGNSALEQASGRICGLLKRGFHTEAVCPEGLHPVGGTHAGAVKEELQLKGRTCVGEAHGGLPPMKGT